MSLTNYSPEANIKLDCKIIKKLLSYLHLICISAWYKGKELGFAGGEKILVWSANFLTYMYEVCPESIQPHAMKNGDIHWRYKIQETLYIGQWCFSPLQSRHLGTSHRSLLMAARTHSTFSGAQLIAGLPECGSLPADSQPPLRHSCHTFVRIALVTSSPKAFWITWIVFMEEHPSLMQNLMQIHCSTRSVILNAQPHSTRADLAASSPRTN